MKSPLLSLVLFSSMLGITYDVRAETSELLAKHLVNICQGKPISEWDKRTPDYLKAYCDGYVEATTVLFLSDTIVNFMSKSTCFDLGSYIPSWEGPIHDAVANYIAAGPEVSDNESAPTMIANAVAKQFPCTKGSKPAGVDDYRVYGKREIPASQ